MLFCQENICFADRNKKTTINFCATLRRMLLQQMTSFEVFITFNANKIHQCIRHFYELLNTGVHNMSHLSICMVFFSMSNQQTLNGLSSSH
jgi:hypothetical protein